MEREETCERRGRRKEVAAVEIVGDNKEGLNPVALSEQLGRRYSGLFGPRILGDPEPITARFLIRVGETTTESERDREEDG